MRLTLSLLLLGVAVTSATFLPKVPLERGRDGRFKIPKRLPVSAQKTAYEVCASGKHCVPAGLCQEGYYKEEHFPVTGVKHDPEAICGPFQVFRCCAKHPGDEQVRRKRQTEAEKSDLDKLIDAALEEGTDTATDPIEVPPGAGVPEAIGEIDERIGYLPPQRQEYGVCGVEYDCVPWYLCQNGEINTSGFGIIDKRTRPAAGEVENTTEVTERQFGGYYGGFSTIPDKACPLGPDEQGQCCRKPRADVCPPEHVCVPGWHCPSHDGSQYVDLRSHPRGCQHATSQYAVCCEPRSLYPPVPRTCGVRNPDGIYPAAELPTNYVIDKRTLPNPLIKKTEAAFGEFPWQALIFRNSPAGYQFLCGGVLISSRHLLTAAHYVYAGNNVTAYDLQVRLGEWEVNTLNEPIEHQDYYVESISIHPEYRPGPEFNDIAIITLNKDVYITNNVHTACLPDGPYATYDGYRCIATGWGKDAFEGRYSQLMKKVDLPMIRYDDCQNALRTTRLTSYFRLHPNFVCAGGEAGKDACTGDGGGPLVCNVEGNYVVAGITSWGIGCGTAGIPGVYASVAKAMPWINEILAYTPHTRFPTDLEYRNGQGREKAPVGAIEDVITGGVDAGIDAGVGIDAPLDSDALGSLLGGDPPQ